MIRGDQLTIGDYVLVDGKIRRVESITKKKIGYHISPTDQLHYARLCEVFPIKIDKLHITGLDGEVNDNIKLAFKCADFDFEQFRKVGIVFRQHVIQFRFAQQNDFYV